MTARDGKWQLKHEAFFDGKKLGHWGLIDVARVDTKAFVDALYNEGCQRGLTIEYPALVSQSYPQNLESTFVAMYKELAMKGKPDMIVVIMPFKDSLMYGTVKTLGDTVYGMPTQIVLKKNAMIGPKSPQTIHNICLKINAKLGGINQTIHLTSRPAILGRPVREICFRQISQKRNVR